MNLKVACVLWKVSTFNFISSAGSVVLILPPGNHILICIYLHISCRKQVHFHAGIIHKSEHGNAVKSLY